VLSTDEFKTFAGEYVMFAHVTTRIEGREHDDLLSLKGFGGFPSLAAMDADGNIIAKLTGSRDVTGFREMMAAGARYEEIRARPDKSLEDEVFLLTHDIEMGNADLPSARARAGALVGLDEVQQRKLDGMLTDLEIRALLGQPRSQEEADELARKAGAAFAEMWAQGREPTSDETTQAFYILILGQAETTQDVALFERALAKLHERFDDMPGIGSFFKAQEERLGKLKASAAEPPGAAEVEDEEAEESGG
jgi:hypothetical protein